MKFHRANVGHLFKTKKLDVIFGRLAQRVWVVYVLCFCARDDHDDDDDDDDALNNITGWIVKKKFSQVLLWTDVELLSNLGS